MSSSNSLQSLQFPVENLLQPTEDLKNPGLTPILPPEYENDIQAWLAALAELNEMRQKILALAHELKHMKNVMFGVIEIMGLFGDYQGDKVKALSSIDNLLSDMRKSITNAQNGVNGIGEKTDKNNKGANALKAMVANMEALLRGIQEKYPDLMDKGTIANFKQALNGIKGAFGKDWGDASKMTADIKKWSADSEKGKYSPELKNLQDAMQTLNQSTSALSTSTNTSLQFTAEQVKKMNAMEEAGIQSYLQLTSAEVRAQKSS